MYLSGELIGTPMKTSRIAQFGLSRKGKDLRRYLH